MRKLVAMCLVGLAWSVAGCAGEAVRVPVDARIQLNVPDGPPGTTKTRMLTADLREDRQVFLDLVQSARRVDRCSPSALRDQLGAGEVLEVGLYGKDTHFSLTLLRDAMGRWLTRGYGSVELTDVPNGFPEYEYDAAAIAAVKKWYEAHVAKAGAVSERRAAREGEFSK
jgi:hypothetical protein